ncbi:hypothetical protein FBU30_010302 [Linnemannia zychae]|nr:hypothetical protein FBU30_010302 [Linnemannia zychae]
MLPLQITVRRSSLALYKAFPVATKSSLVRNLSNQAAHSEDSEGLMKHAPGWKHENASESEANVKADREPQPQDVSHLQDETVKYFKKDGEEDFLDNLKAKATEGATSLLHKAKSIGSQASNQGGEYMDKAREAGEEAKREYRHKVKSTGFQASEKGGEYVDQAKRMGEQVSEKGEEYINQAKRMEQQAMRSGQEAKNELKDKAKSTTSQASEKGEEYVYQAKRVGEEFVDQAKRVGQEAKKTGEKYMNESDYTDKIKKEAYETQGMLKDGAQKVSDFVKSTVDSAKKAVGMNSNKH